jgi:hypothetical protein
MVHRGLQSDIVIEIAIRLKYLMSEKYLMERNAGRLIPAIVAAALLGIGSTQMNTLAGEAVISKNSQGHYVLMHEGKNYFIRGAGGTDHLVELVKNGGNSIRTWGIESLEQLIDGKRLIDRCKELGITVTAGIWIQHERHGFDYSDAEQIRKQREAVREAVRKYKNEPALLMWGLGNEMEGPESETAKPDVWKELNELAAIVKSEDSNHPVMTVIAGASAIKIRGILEHYPNIDILGVNAYAAASSAASQVKAAGWQKPFVLTEFGPSGHWEVPKTAWDAPIEPTSREKSNSYYVTHGLLLDDASEICLGSYCFLWGQKQETTSTWYGMFLQTGEKLPQVDAMCRAWTGKWPKNRCPKVEGIEIDSDEAIFKPGEVFKANLSATDPENDPLDWTWVVQQESADVQSGGDRESVPDSLPECTMSHSDGDAVIRAPKNPGSYRLFAIVKDGQGGASVENVCFQVK